MSGKCKRPDEIREYFSRKMKWLSEQLKRGKAISLPSFYALVVEFLSNEADGAAPRTKRSVRLCGQ